MEFLGLTLSEWILPIMIGIIAGLVTNAVAIWMLFHPYRPIKVGSLQILPMGAVPKEIDRIAKRIGETVGRDLLTPEDITRTLSSDAFRSRFDDALRGALMSLVEQRIGPTRELLTAAQIIELERVLQRILDKVFDGLGIYLDSDDWEDRVRTFARGLSGEFRQQPFSVLLTPTLQDDLNRGLAQLWGGVRDSQEFARVISEALERGIEGFLSSEMPLRHYIPAGAVNVGEAVVANYLPILLDRLGGVLDHPVTREKLQDALRRFADRFLDAQKSWKRLVGKLVITERTLAQTVEAIEQGGVDEISGLLREPEVQARIATVVNGGLEDLLDKPVREIFGDITPERAERLRAAMVERVLYLFRHPTTEEVVLGRLRQVVGAAADRTVGDAMRILGEERARELTDQAADWVVRTLRGDRALSFLRSVVEQRTSWMLSVPIGRIGDFVPPEGVRGAEQMLFDPLWAFLQKRVPAAVAGLPIAVMVEEKLRAYPIQKVEEIIWRVSKKELVLIVYLGGFLGAIVGAIMLSLESLPAGLFATGTFILLALVFINMKS